MSYESPGHDVEDVLSAARDLVVATKWLIGTMIGLVILLLMVGMTLHPRIEGLESFRTDQQDANEATADVLGKIGEALGVKTDEQLARIRHDRDAGDGDRR